MNIIKLIVGAVAPGLVSQIVLGGLVAALAGGLVWHIMAVNAAYERGATAARAKCSSDAAYVRLQTETMYRIRARGLEELLRKYREADQKVEETEASTAGLEGALSKMKADPQCWSKEVVREIQK